ncbi:probable E3 ubiquitin-protein ligase RHC2A [Cannabis sativa]|uniref:RING-type E3 ubiquitin transferase n=1 Tax=Cannabis sativa TaxID=3483 RepID=A0A803R558_CANSA|nr:probable E3 ubiquitin-protein ligase RHC2A [Cannabis sativa]
MDPITPGESRAYISTREIFCSPTPNPRNQALPPSLILYFNVIRKVFEGGRTPIIDLEYNHRYQYPLHLLNSQSLRPFVSIKIFMRNLRYLSMDMYWKIASSEGNYTSIPMSVEEVLNKFCSVLTRVIESGSDSGDRAIEINIENHEHARPLTLHHWFIPVQPESPVGVGASLEGLEKVKSDDVVSSSGEKMTCPICFCNVLSGTELSRLPCSHLFHTHCILKWLEKRHTCPMCRFELPTRT